MKRFLTAAILLMATFAALPLLGQSAKALNADGKLNRNPVRYADAGAFSDGRGVWLEWRTEVETSNLGFYLYRIVGGGERELVSPALIPGADMQAREGKITAGSYSFFDRYGDVNSVYVIESFHTSGQKYNSNPVQTQFVDDLERVAGISSKQLDAQARAAAPIVLGSRSILPRDLASEVRQSSRPADAATQRWVAAQPGVRIGVREAGLYRVSRADLQTNGFDVNAPAERWQLYAGGVEQAINVGGGGDYIEFYGRAIDTIDSGTQIYFLIVGAQNGKRIGSTLRRRVGGSVLSQSYSQSFIKKERLFYIQDILNGDAENVFGTTFSQAFPGTVDFNLTGVDFSSVNSSLDITLQGITLIAHQSRIVLNGVELGVVAGSNYNQMNGHFDFPTSVLREGANTLVLTSFGQSDISAFDRIKVNFARLYRAEQNRLSFFVPNYKASYAENFASPNIRVFDTTNADAPLLISGLTVEQQNGGGYRVYLPSNRGRVLFAVEDSGILPAASISQNFPSTLSTAANNGELIIISHKDFLTQAEAWADYRRAQGLIVKVVNIEDVYDEFSFGVVSPDSIRSFLKYAKDEWQTKPNYALFIGDATFDPRNYFGAGANYVPTRMVDTIYSETGSDETLADFNDDGLAEIAVGRIPARNAATVTMLLDKMTTFEQTAAQGLSRGAIFASDLPDGYNFEALSDRLCQQLPANIPCVKINRALPNANGVLVNEMNNGRFIVNYSGHGNVGVWAAGSFFSSTHAAQLNHANKAIYTMLTCLNGYFINPTDSLSEVLLKNPNGGAVSTWASSGLTTPDVQEVMATRFYNQIAAGNITRIGDLIKDAKTTINFGRDVRLSWVLLGDPTMKVK